MNATLPLVSAIIPTFNRASTVCRAVYSALMQSYSNIEVLVIDDGSNDDTIPILGRFHDDRLRVSSIKHGGVAAARNHGISAAHGEWIAFLDSDDWWHPEKLSNLLLPNPIPYDIICHDCVVENSSRRTFIRCGWEEARYSSLSLFFLGNRFATSAVVLRKSILESEPRLFDPIFTPAEDYELWTRLAYHNPRFQFIHRPLTHYFTHDGQLTSNPAALLSGEIKVVHECAARWGDQISREIGKSAYYKRISEGYLKLAMHYLRIGDRANARLQLAHLHRYGFMRKHAIAFFSGSGNGVYQILRRMKRSLSRENAS